MILMRATTDGRELDNIKKGRDIPKNQCHPVD